MWIRFHRPISVPTTFADAMKKPIATVLLCLTSLNAAPGFAQTCSKQSPNHTIPLLELYTSEGCSSCPPADHAVSALQKAASEDKVVPLALHVDYWDYIGWTDRFAKPGFAQRQHWLTDLTGSRVVYTPELFVAGHEVRDWSSILADRMTEINGKAPQANIGIRLGALSGSTLPVEITTRAPLGSKLYVALYENGLSSNVKSGENSGVTLKHDFVVRDWQGPITLRAASSNATRMLNVPAAAVTKQLGVAAFVQDNSGDVLQALALPLCGG
jgi:hypothetical protein